MPKKSYQELLIENHKLKKELARKKEGTFPVDSFVFRQMTERSIDVIWVMDLTWKCIYISPSIEQFQGYTQAEFYSVKTEHSLTPQSWQEAQEIMAKLVNSLDFKSEEAKKIKAQLTLSYYHKDGSIRWGDLIASFLYDDSGEFIGILGITRDITEKMKREMNRSLQHNLAKELAYSPDIDFAFSAILKTFIAFDGVDYGAIYLSEQERITQKASTSTNFGVNKQALASAFKGRTCIRQFQRKPWQAYFPVQHMDRVIGAVVLGSSKDRELAKSLEEELRTILTFAAGAVEKLRADTVNKESAERLYAVLEATAEGVWDINFKTGENYFSKNYYEILGYRPEEIKNKLDFFFERLHPEDKEKVETLLQKHLQGEKESYAAEFRLLAKDNKWHWITSRAKVLTRDENRQPLRIIGTHEDITEQKQIEQDLEDSRNYLSAVIENLPVALFSKDARTGKFLIWNKKCEEYYGVSKDKAFSSNSYEIFPKKDAEFFERSDLETLTLGDIRELPEYSYFSKSLGNLILKTYKFPLFDYRDFPHTVLGFTIDVTAQKQAEEQLLKMTRFFEEVLQNSHNLIYRFNMKKNRFDYVSFYTLTFTGLTYEKFMGLDWKSYLRLIYPEDRKLLLGNITYAMEKGERIVSLTHELRKKNVREQYHWVREYLTLYFDEGNNLETIVSISYSINAEKLKEVRISENEARQRTMLENLPLSIALINKGNDLITWANTSFRELLGYNTEEVKFLSAEKLFPSQENRREFCCILEKKKEVKETEFTFCKRNGQLLTVLLSVLSTTISDQEVYLAAGVDITAKIVAQRELRKMTGYFEDILQVSQNIVYRYDLQKEKFDYLSNYAEKFLGRPLQELLGSDWESVFPAVWQDDLPNQKVRVKQTFKPGAGPKHAVFEYRIKLPNGDYHWLREYSTATFDENGLPQNTMGAIYDVSEEKRVELALKDHERQLKEAIRTKDKFFSILAHDLKNPFAGIQLMAKFLVDNFDSVSPEKIVSSIKMIYQSTHHTYNLLENLLDWSRLQSGRIQPQMQKVNFFAIAQETILLHISTAKNKNIKLRNKISRDCQVFADPYMLKTILRNLVSNAVKFTPSGGIVTVSNLSRSEETEISVSDTGVGIAPEILKDLFDLDKKTKTENGSGLGLLVCSEFIEKMQGKLGVESVVGAGSRFYVTLLCRQQ